MKEHRTAFRYFTIMEYEKEQRWLEERHRAGWKLVGAMACFYRFERCQPEEVVYQLDYSEDGRARRAEYLQLFRDCGWEHVLDNVGYSYFRKRRRRCVAMKGFSATWNRAGTCSGASCAGG